ncbi:hypothetical protein [Oceanisphaera sp. KMM 10153]|uniref:hypothetical protein n=1 Tax=Oceanisphaera submarina TaxID=3390193 RepID=UPI003974E4F8
MIEWIALAVFIFFWFGIAKQLKKNGRGWFSRNVIAGSGASIAFIVVAAIGISTDEPEQAVRSATITEIQSSQPPQTQHSAPESTKGEMWEFVVNNAQRTADAYAAENNPSAVFIGNSVQVDFIQQQGGLYDGRYLLKLVNQHGDNTSFMMLLPLFDEYASTEGLDDEGELWQVVEFSFNGKLLSDSEQNATSPSNQFDLTPDEYFQRLEAAFKSKGLSYALGKREHVSGSHADSVSATLGQFTAISLTLNKNSGRVESVTLIGAGDGSEASGYEIMFTGAASQAAAAGVDYLDDIILSAADMMKGEDKLIGPAKLSVTHSPELGVWYISVPI